MAWNEAIASSFVGDTAVVCTQLGYQRVESKTSNAILKAELALSESYTSH